MSDVDILSWLLLFFVLSTAFLLRAWSRYWAQERLEYHEAKRKLEEVRRRKALEQADYYAVLDD